MVNLGSLKLGAGSLSDGPIELRGVSVHNLKRVDVDIPRGQLVVLCGVSGSGKTSLAIDTLYAEGQRRYIESFSAYTRQFLDQFDKPNAERIDGIPPAIAVVRRPPTRSGRSTVGTATDVMDYLRLFFSRFGQIQCRQCQQTVRCDSPDGVADQILQLPADRRVLLTFPVERQEEEALAERLSELMAAGFVRAILRESTIELASARQSLAADPAQEDGQLRVVVDRWVTGRGRESRLRDSIETAYRSGAGKCEVLVESDGRSTGSARHQTVDQRTYECRAYSHRLECADCGIRYTPLSPELFNFNSALGACPACNGFGNTMEIDMDLVVPDPTKTLRDGAIAPWTSPAYAHELDELIALADGYDLPVDIPYAALDESHRRLIRDGVPERDFGGLNGFFAWLERRKYKTPIRVFLSRWRTASTCTTCHGTRLCPDARVVSVANHHLAELSQGTIEELSEFLGQLKLPTWQTAAAKIMIEQIQDRIGYLQAVGLQYLTLDRGLKTLSGGEAQRVALTSAFGSSLVNLLYVLDEPTVGLHPQDVGRLVEAIVALRDRGTSVVVVEHEEKILRAADQLIEFGPGAGERGGEVVFQGTVQEMEVAPQSLTGQYLSGRRGAFVSTQRRAAKRGRIRLAGARGHNLKGITVEFPIGLLCVVTGVSGSGKSTLVQDTLYGALCHRKRKSGPAPQPYDDIYGDGQIDDVVLVDQSPIGRSPRSNPVTYIKAFDVIRSVFASTVDARTHNYGPGHFSFNVDGGRCDACRGEGYQAIDMQFLADVYMRCDQCQGARYRREILEVTYRRRNIADVLEMTVREAFGFFRGHPKVQAKLKQLIDVGLDYLRLGQPATTLSSGEAQRLRLAAFMAAAKRKRTLFLLDEPTTGLHFSDVVKLLDCFEALLSVGHSLIVVEHRLQIMKAADYIVDLGPGAADAGGQVVACGTPEQVALCAESATGAVLREQLRPTATGGDPPQGDCPM